MILKEVNSPRPALASRYFYSYRIVFWCTLVFHFPCQERGAEGNLRTTGYLYKKSLLFQTNMQYLHTKEENLPVFLLGCTAVKVETMLTLHCQFKFSLLIIYWGEWEVSHTCQGYLSQQALQTWARTRSESSVCKLSIGGVDSLDYYFLVVILLHVISSFTLNLLLFHEISEQWGTNACILPLCDWGGRTASREPELPARRISVLKALNSTALFPTVNSET